LSFSSESGEDAIEFYDDVVYELQKLNLRFRKKEAAKKEVADDWSGTSMRGDIDLRE
jgi:hypothetical protein